MNRTFCLLCKTNFVAAMTICGDGGDWNDTRPRVVSTNSKLLPASCWIEHLPCLQQSIIHLKFFLSIQSEALAAIRLLLFSFVQFHFFVRSVADVILIFVFLTCFFPVFGDLIFVLAVKFQLLGSKF